MKLLFALLFCLQALSSSASISDEYLANLAETRNAIFEVFPDQDLRAQRLHEEFSILLKTAGVTEPVRLIVTTAPDIIGQSYPGRTIAVNLEVGEVSREQRMFIMAHELSHVLMDHLGDVVKILDEQENLTSIRTVDSTFFRKFLTPVSHRNEFTADAFAAKILLKMKLSVPAAAAFFAQQVNDPETLGHPAAAVRMARLTVQPSN